MGMTDLEKLVTDIQMAGKAWIDAKEKADQLDADEKNLLASLMNDLEKKEFAGQKVSDAKLERLARGGEAFRTYVRGRIMAQTNALRLKVRYENLDKLWESKRSDQSTERQKIARGIFATGRG
jgi:hypothetical protein